MPAQCLPFLDLPLGKSGIWLALALCAHGAPVLCLLFSGTAFWGALAAPLLLTSFILGLRRDYLRCTAAAVCQLRFHAGRWRLLSGTGCWHSAHLDGEQLVTPFLTLLRLRLDDDQGRPVGHRHLVIFQDAADQELLRQLRVLLRFGPIKETAPPLSH
ncbi:MAG: hypothetical protein OXC07_01675 [Kistimonas sp.]|nr:hypothetical protein [Kistimonas sp.]